MSITATKNSDPVHATTRHNALVLYLLPQLLKTFPIHLISTIHEYTNPLDSSNFDGNALKRHWGKLLSKTKFISALSNTPLCRSLSVSAEQIPAYFPNLLPTNVDVLDLPVQMHHVTFNSNRLPVSYELESFSYGLIRYSNSDVASALTITDGVIAFPFQANYDSYPDSLKQAFLPAGFHAGFSLGVTTFTDMSHVKDKQTYVSLTLKRNDRSITVFPIPARQTRDKNYQSGPEFISWMYIVTKETFGQTSSHYVRMAPNNPALTTLSTELRALGTIAEDSTTPPIAASKQLKRHVSSAPLATRSPSPFADGRISPYVTVKS